MQKSLAPALVPALALALLATTAGQALAHARLIRAEPRVGATVRSSPTEVILYYSESIAPSQSSVKLNGPAGPVPIAPIAVDANNPRIVHVAPKAPLGPGAYHLAWRMHTDDGHTTQGDFTFKVAR